MGNAVVEKRVDRLEEALMELAHQSLKTEIELDRLSREMRQFKDEMRDFKDETRASRDEMNRRWGDLANPMGTLVEDIVTPGVPSAIKRTFGWEVEDIHRNRRKKKGDRRREFDVIAVADGHVFLIDVKSTYRAQDVAEFAGLLSDFLWFFPEYKKAKVVGVVASLDLGQDIANLATRKGYLALNSSGDYLQFVNAAEVRM
jgi:hypothetical protein